MIRFAFGTLHFHQLFAGDNAGPHTPAQVESRFAQLRQRFPQAEITGATWESFIDGIIADGSSGGLPVVSKEEGDTWIYGVQQDLYKTAAFRAIMRARRACLAALGAAKCGATATPALENATRFALKMGEHTWGFNWGYLDQIHYTNTALADALQNVGGFAKTQDGWREQRAYVQHTVDALAAGAADGADTAAAWLLNRSRAELEELRPAELAGSTAVDPAKWAAIDAAAEVELPQFTLKWNTTAGGLASVVDTGTKHEFARKFGSLGQYQYQTLTEDDFWVFMRASLKVDRDVAFAKANLTANAPDVVSGFWTGNLSGVYRRITPAAAAAAAAAPAIDSFLQLITLPAALHIGYGAPRTVCIRFDVSRLQKKIDIQLSWYGKTRTRLPEAHWLDFEMVPPVASTQQQQLQLPRHPRAACPDSWVVSKLNSSFCATDVSLFGGTHVHAVGDEGGVSWSDEGTLKLRSKDAALFSLEYKTAFPYPVNKSLDVGATAVYANLCNNFWTTNVRPETPSHTYVSLSVQSQQKLLGHTNRTNRNHLSCSIQTGTRLSTVMPTPHFDSRYQCSDKIEVMRFVHHVTARHHTHGALVPISIHPDRSHKRGYPAPVTHSASNIMLGRLSLRKHRGCIARWWGGIRAG
eukprot:SAG11_NODE_265_length_11509_cov_26.341455_5_plen_639_part_00